MKPQQRMFSDCGPGFTLIELVTVLGLVALFAATVAVTWRPSSAARLQAAQMIVEQFVAEARERAAALQVPVRLVAVCDLHSNAAAASTRWHLRLFRAALAGPDGWQPDGSKVWLPEDVMIGASSTEMLPARLAEFGASVHVDDTGATVWYVEFQPDGGFQPRNESGEGVMAVSVAEHDGGSRRRTVQWRANGGMTRGVEEVSP
jgi:prepilin-type N-terminal cleavage/methylation domain-containing protein